MTTAILIFIAILSLVAKDYVLLGAALLLVIIHLLQAIWLLETIQKPAFSIGLFFLMIYILIPIAKGKLDYASLATQLLSWKVVLAIGFGFLISYIGGKGIGILPAQPVLLVGVTIGTLLAVLFTNGLPAGLIIAAGCLAILSKWFSL